MNKKSSIPFNSDVRFEITTKCNYSCIICPRDKITRRLETMSLLLFKRVFDKINRETAQYNTITFPGMGEPLLDKGIDAKILYAKKKKTGISVLLLTNGLLLTPERFRQLEGIGVSSIRVSCYGNDAKTYMKAHGVKASRLFSRVRDNLVKISQMRRSTQLLLTFNVINGVNEGIAESWINFWADKADLVEVWRPHNWVYGKEFRAIQSAKLKTCGRPFKGPLQVQADGTVNMCCFDFDGRLTLGDLKYQTLREIFSSPLYRKISACHKTGNFKGSGLICENCDQRNKNKDDVMVYNSKFDVNSRVRMISTTYKAII